MFIPVAASDVKQKNIRFPRLFGLAFALCRRILLSDPVRGFTCDTRIDLRIEPGPIPAGNRSTAAASNGTVGRNARRAVEPHGSAFAVLDSAGLSCCGAVSFGQGGKLKKKIPELRLALQGKLTEHHRFPLRLLMDQLDGLELLIARVSA